MTRAIALVTLLTVLPAWAEEPGTRPPDELPRRALTDEYWGLWWSKPGYAGPIWWGIVGAGALAGGSALAVSCVTDPHGLCNSGSGFIVPVAALVVGAIVLPLAIYWGVKRSGEIKRYDDRMDAITRELTRRGYPAP